MIVENIMKDSIYVNGLIHYNNRIMDASNDDNTTEEL